MKKERFITITGMLLASLVLASFVACGSGTPGSEPTKTAIAPTSTTPPEATSTATSIPPTPTEIPLPVASQVASGTETDAVLIADGKLLFDKTAGNLGCAYCHQSDATGDLEIGSPDIRGVTESQIIDALQTRVQMTFLDLSDYEVSAVAAYLATLDR